MGEVQIIAAVGAVIALITINSNAAAADTERKGPSSAYVLKAAKDASLCREANRFLNALPNLDLRKASVEGSFGFLRWEHTKFVESEVPGVAKSYFGASRLVVPLAGNEQRTVFRWTYFDRYGQESDNLFVLPANERSPTDGSEFKTFLFGRSPTYGNTLGYEYISQLQQMHGSRWKEWDISGNASISAFMLAGKTHFLAATLAKPERVLVFTIDSQDRQQQHCIFARR